jgi:uncharacterized membrane protein YozB (DUF420 family)
VTLDDLPPLNAALNSAATALILLGRRFAKRKAIAAHKRCMLAAVSLSALFLASYLTYHIGKQGLMTPFKGEGWSRGLYFTVLFTHLPLAAGLLPLIGIALFHGLRGNVARHRAVVKWAWPVWLYVSVTGVAIYFMLYRIWG